MKTNLILLGVYCGIISAAFGMLATLLVNAIGQNLYFAIIAGFIVGGVIMDLMLKKIEEDFED